MMQLDHILTFCLAFIFSGISNSIFSVNPIVHAYGIFLTRSNFSFQPMVRLRPPTLAGNIIGHAYGIFWQKYSHELFLNSPIGTRHILFQ